LGIQLEIKWSERKSMTKTFNQWNSEMEYYQKIYNLITSYGEKFRKKHGEWYRYTTSFGYTLTLDTWNGNIALFCGDCIPMGEDYLGNLVCFGGKSKSLASYYNNAIQNPNNQLLLTVWSLLRWFEFPKTRGNKK
jgi:hypothetical protein